MTSKNYSENILLLLFLFCFVQNHAFIIRDPFGFVPYPGTGYKVDSIVRESTTTRATPTSTAVSSTTQSKYAKYLPPMFLNIHRLVVFTDAI